MSETVTVEAIKDARDWSSTDGKINLTFYTLDITRADGTTEEVDHSRKLGGSEPQPGERLEVIFEPGKFRPKMKKAPNGQYAGGGNRAKESTVKKRDWTPEADRDPERSARILRQHSQEMALRMLSLDAVQTSREDFRFNFEDVRKLADQFDADVDIAGKAALQGAGGSPPPPPSPPAPGKPPVDLQELEEALDNAGLTDPKSRGAVALYMATKLPDDRREKATKNIAQHEDLARQKKTIDALVEATEKDLGGPLPKTSESYDPSDSLPF